MAKNQGNEKELNYSIKVNKFYGIHVPVYHYQVYQVDKAGYDNEKKQYPKWGGQKFIVFNTEIYRYERAKGYKVCCIKIAN